MIEHIALMKVREGHYRTFCRGHPKMLDDMLLATDTRRNTINRNYEYALMELLMQERVIMEVMDENDTNKKCSSWKCPNFEKCQPDSEYNYTCNNINTIEYCGKWRKKNGIEKANTNTNQ